MKLLIKKWGNSAAIRLPSALLQSIRTSIDSEVEIEESNGRLVITPVPESYNLDDLIDGINDANIHHEISFGKPEGEEML